MSYLDCLSRFSLLAHSPSDGQDCVYHPPTSCATPPPGAPHTRGMRPRFDSYPLPYFFPETSFSPLDRFGNDIQIPRGEHRGLRGWGHRAWRRLRRLRPRHGSGGSSGSPRHIGGVGGGGSGGRGGGSGSGANSGCGGGGSGASDGRGGGLTARSNHRERRLCATSPDP